jgi:hypothetical protein
MKRKEKMEYGLNVTNPETMKTYALRGIRAEIERLQGLEQQLAGSGVSESHTITAPSAKRRGRPTAARKRMLANLAKAREALAAKRALQSRRRH